MSDVPTAVNIPLADVSAGTPSTPMPPVELPPVPAPEPLVTNVAPQETIVIPASPENPFIPPPIPPSGGSSPVKRLFMILVFTILLGGIGIAGWYAWNLMQEEKTVTIRYWGLWENDNIIAPVIADFESSHPKIKVEYVKESHKQYRERLSAAIVRGDGPDVFRFHNTWVPMMVDVLSRVPPEVMTAGEFSQAFYPVAGNDLVAGSVIYGIPLMIDGLGLYYNEDIFSSAGVTPPQTWEDVLNLVPKLTVKDGTTITTSAIALGTTNNVEHYSDIIATMMMQNGVNPAEPTGQPAEEALIFYRKFADPNDPVYTWNESLDNSVAAFAAGRVAMIVAPSWRAFDIKAINPDGHFKVIPIPQLPGNTVTWASYWVEGVSEKSKYQTQAWEFVKFLTSRESAQKMFTQESNIRLFGEPYARIELGSSIQADPYVGAYISQAATAKSFPLASRTFDNGINDRMIKYMEDAVNGMRDGAAPSAVLITVASGFKQVLSGYGLVSSAPTQ